MKTIVSICARCKHRKIYGCKAFPEGIPADILRTNEHSKPLPDQDNDLVFEEGDTNIFK